MKQELDEDGFPKGMHWCSECLGWYSWNHKPACGMVLFWRRVVATLKGRVRVRVEWY
jgi:hypothetical protein